MVYYLNRHIPMVRQLLGSSLKGVSVERGIFGARPRRISLWGTLLFESVEDFQASFGPHAQPIVEDVPKYTNSEPLIQI